MLTRRTGRSRWYLAAALSFAVIAGAVQQPAPGQPVPAPRLPALRAVAQKDGNAGKKDPPGPPILPASYPGGLYPGVPVILPDVLRLAVLANLDIAQANLAVERARNAIRGAYAQFLPNLALGSTYVRHEGRIQTTEGPVIDVNRDSLFVGGGPSFNLPFHRALFGPQEARRLLDAARAGHARVTNETLLRVVDAYFALLRARRQVARLDEVLEVLTAEQESDLRGGSRGLLPLIRAFVRSGTALPSDVARVEADVVRRQGERTRALEEVRTASAELARLLHLDAGHFLIPAEDFRWPLPAPGEPWFNQPLEVLVTQGLQSRPELAENQALIAAAVTRYRAEKWRPLLPTLSTGLTYGGFGGGPRVVGQTATGDNVLGQSGVIANFGPRTDFDVGLYWRLDNLGFGNAVRIRDARLQTQQAEVRQMQIQDLVVAQVVQAVEQVQRGEQRVSVYSAGLFDRDRRPTGAVYRSLRLNFLRIRGGQGLPLEVLDSTRRLSDVLLGYADALSDYDRARYRLLLVLGLPPEGLFEPDCLPLPPRPPAPAPSPGTPECLPPLQQPSAGKEAAAGQGARDALGRAAASQGVPAGLNRPR